MRPQPISISYEQAIACALGAVRRHTTLVVIAHRLSTVVEVGQMLVLHQGEAVEWGTHAGEAAIIIYQLQQAGQALRADAPQALPG